MSDSPLYDLHTAYPFIWQTGEFPEELKAVRDMRIVVMLPSALKLPEDFNCTAVITSLDSTGAQVAVTMRNNGAVIYSEALDIPLLSASAFEDNSFIAVDNGFTAWSDMDSTVQIHPDCIMFMQEAPRLRIRYSNAYTADSSTRTYIEAELESLAFANGNNVSVSGDDLDMSTVVTLDCGSGNGLGVYRTSPWDDKTLASFDIRGLRSLNGLTNDVHITDAPSVEVISAMDALTSTLTLTIKERE